MGLSLLVTGLLREPEIFARLLADWCGPGDVVSEIVVSTWIGQKDAFQTFLAGLGTPLPPVRLVINLEPVFEFGEPRNVMHQRQSLVNGVLACSHPLVFKTRTDFWASRDLWPTLRRAVETSVSGPLKDYDRKIWVPWFDYEEPFHIADEAVFGTRRDLLRLASKDVCDLSEFGFPLANQHTMLFKPGYEVTGRVFRDWLRAQRVTGVLVNDPTPRKHARLAALLRTDAYQQMVAVYHRYLVDNVAIGSAPGQLVFRPTGGADGLYYTNRQLDDRPSPTLFDPTLAGFHNHFYAWTRESFDRLVATTIADPASQAYATAFHNASRYPALADESMLHQFIVALKGVETV